MKLILRPIALGIIVILLSTASVLAQAPAQQQQPEFVKQGQQLMRAGKPEEALALYRQTLQTSPDWFRPTLRRRRGSECGSMEVWLNVRANPVQLAKQVFDIAIGEVEDTVSESKRHP